MIKLITIYIIDDDADDRDFLTDVLKELYPGIECFTASNGQEGLKKLETGAVPLPSLIFLDLNMPRLNGRQVLARLKADPAWQAVPVFIYTTSSNQKEIEELKALGAADYVVKQADDSLLKEALLKAALAF